MSQQVDAIDTPPAAQIRQKPGMACEECRRRKLRCDRQEPQCGSCKTSGVVCQVITSRHPRGPKRGYLKALQARIAALEGSLSQQQQNDKNVIPSTGEYSLETLLIDPQIDVPWDGSINDEDPSLRDSYLGTKSSNSSGGSSVDGHRAGAVTPPPNDFPNVGDDFAFQDSVLSLRRCTKVKISDLMQADLDQLYLDRIQTFMPILHQRRYFSWRGQSAKTEAQSCLQYAMWTLAASVSAHYQNIGDSLYQYTRTSLDALDQKTACFASPEIEQVQAWLLLALHEFMCVDFRRGWISAGRAFRLIQFNWLHETNAPELSLSQSDWVDTEQKRRTFWMAYCLDRFVSMRTGSPLTFSEHIAIRLPAPEVNFQNDHPILMGFLTEVITGVDTAVTSAFTECIIVATISGRALSHRHQCSVGNIHFNATEDFWSRHKWIDAVLTQRMESFSLNYPAAAQQADPMLLFVGMMWWTIILYLYQTMECVVQPTDDKRPEVMEYMGRSTIAAQEIVTLSKELSQLNCLKIHPLTTVPLSLCAEFFIWYHDHDDSFSHQLQDITEAMCCLKRFNNLGRGLM